MVTSALVQTTHRKQPILFSRVVNAGAWKTAFPVTVSFGDLSEHVFSPETGQMTGLDHGLPQCPHLGLGIIPEGLPYILLNKEDFS